jgi:DNA adenine methylase
MTSKNGNGYKPVNSPFKWVGGKSRLRKNIIPLIPAHTCFVDLFAGAAWVLFGKPPSQVEVLNDLDGNVINFFRVVKYKPEALIESFEWELVSRAEFKRLAELDLTELTDIQRAHRFYYLIMAGWGGELAYPRFQSSITDGGHGNRLFGAIKTLRSRIEPVHQRLSTVIIENLDWEACLETYDSATTVFYVDPPYPDNKCNYAHNMREWETHVRLYERLKRAEAKWLISSYDTPQIREEFKSSAYHIIPIRSFSGMSTDRSDRQRVENRELVICNFTPSQALSEPEETSEEDEPTPEVDSKSDVEMRPQSFIKTQQRRSRAQTQTQTSFVDLFGK